MPKVKKHKPILALHDARPPKKAKQKAASESPASAAAAAPPPPRKRAPQQQPPAGWAPAAVIDRQAAEAVARLLRAAETQRSGATIKSLCLAPHVVHKKPTFAVTCETLKREFCFFRFCVLLVCDLLHNTDNSPPTKKQTCHCCASSSTPHSCR